MNLVPTEVLPEVSHFIACKNYEEKVTTIHTSKSYYDVISREHESNQQGQRDKSSSCG